MSGEVRGWLFVAGQVRQLEEAEQLAVEQEDFESAANLSSELDALRSHFCPTLSTKSSRVCQACGLFLARHTARSRTTNLPHNSVTHIPAFSQTLLTISSP